MQPMLIKPFYPSSALNYDGAERRGEGKGGYLTWDVSPWQHAALASQALLMGI